jgi:hypothetical protein
MDSALLANDTLKSDVVSPLTPALSLRERGKRGLSFDNSKFASLAGALARILPLPKGEDWGEGEQAARPTTALNVTYSACRGVGVASPCRGERN